MEAIELYKEEVLKEEEHLANQAAADKEVCYFHIANINFGSRIPEITL